MTETKLFDLTQTHVLREMQRSESDPLADPQFQRSVGRVLTAGERESQTARLRPADSHLQSRFRRFAAGVALAALLASPAAAMRVKARPAPAGAPAVASVLHPACPAAHGPFGSFTVAGSRVVCLVDHDAAGRYELFSAPATGGPAVKLSPTMAADRDVIRFAVSPDGAAVAFTADPLQWTRYELHTVTVAGGAATRISGEVAFDHDVDGILWSSRGDQVVFRYGRNATGVWNLYAVPARGGARRQLNPPPVANGAVQPTFGVALGHAWYSCDCERDEQFQLYEAPLPGTIFGDGFEGGNTGGWR